MNPVALALHVLQQPQVVLLGPVRPFPGRPPLVDEAVDDLRLVACLVGQVAHAVEVGRGLGALGRDVVAQLLDPLLTQRQHDP